MPPKAVSVLTTLTIATINGSSSEARHNIQGSSLTLLTPREPQSGPPFSQLGMAWHVHGSSHGRQFGIRELHATYVVPRGRRRWGAPKDICMTMAGVRLTTVTVEASSFLSRRLEIWGKMRGKRPERQSVGPCWDAG